MKQVAFFEFSVFPSVFPLVSGYLEAAARQDPELEQAFAFQKRSFVTGDPGIEPALDAIEADVYAFSCYVWNTGLIKRLLARLVARRGEAHIVLGGPQVMKRGQHYLSPDNERMLICNGEGERTFPAILRQLLQPEPDFAAVRGVSFYRDGELITTEPEPRIRELEEIPSPYLEGYMDATRFTWAVLETNRGCPFRCTYCYWGGATNAKVHKYGEGRIIDEITWCSENSVMYVFIADANFGMLKRDIEIARHLAACKERTGYPLSVYFSSSKNTPERVSTVALILAEAGLVPTQPISLQTMTRDVLVAVKRENIKTESYAHLQHVLNERGVSSFLEMIWPLPGETLASFQDGIEQLCDLEADSFIVYPLLLIGNVELETQQEEYGLVSIDDPDPDSEARIVIASRDVSHEDYLEGVRLTYHVTSLYSLRGLSYVARYLNEAYGIGYKALFARFAAHCRGRPRHPYSAFIERIISANEQYKFSAIGGVVHNVLHTHRRDFDNLLADFLSEAGWLDDEAVALRLDLDLLRRPYVYANTPLGKKDLRVLSLVSADKRGVVVSVPAAHRAEVADLLGATEQGSRWSIRYRRGQVPFMRGKSLDDNYGYCQDRLHKIRDMLPIWTCLEKSGADKHAIPAGLHGSGGLT